MVDIHIDGQVITATDGHPFWVPDARRWVPATDLRAGDAVLLADGTITRVQGVRSYTEVRRVHNLSVEGIHTYFVSSASGGEPVLVHNCGSSFFRGAKPGQSPSFTPRPNEFRVDPRTGFVKETHGVSVFDNPASVSSKGFVPHQVNQATVPESLRIIQRGADLKHFEVVPRPGANLTPQQFIDALCKIQCLPPGG